MMRVGEGEPAVWATGDDAGAETARAPSRSNSSSFPRRELAAALVLAITYYGSVHVGIALTFAPNPVSTLWPPNAILLTALLLTPPRAWWLMIGAVLPAHFPAELALGVPFTMTALWFVSNAAEALLGAAVMVRILGRAPRFDRVRDLSVFLLAGVLFAPLVTSFLDVGFVALVGWRYSGEYWEVWRMRMFSNALASLTLVPLIVIWARRGLKPLRQTTLLEHAEVVLLLAGLCVTSAVVFQHSHSPGGLAVLMYAPLPFLMWAAVRHGVSGVSLCVAIVAAFAIAGVLRGQSPFASGAAPEDDALALQVFLIIVEASLMLLAASLAELRHARSVSLRHEEKLNLALSAAQMETWEWDIARDRITWRSAEGSAANADTPSSLQSMAALLDRVHEDDRPGVIRAVNDALEGGDHGEVEYRFLGADGGHRWITTKGKVVADAKGKAQRMVGLHVDTTHRKLQEMQTRAQQEQLTRLSRISILGELSGALAHELNQPLTAILINAQAARLEIEGHAPDLREITEILSDIVADDKRAGAVISRLRALFVQGAVQMQGINVNECVREVLGLEHSDLIRRSVAADVRLAADIPVVLADRVQLQQVLLNLVVNACDAMTDNDSRDRRLRIVTASNTDGGVDIEIRDSGHGIEDNELIFQPFFSTKDHGIGLGLSICRTIIAAHHGRLWADNNNTRGATFHISLPGVSAGSTGIGNAGSGEASNGSYEATA